MAAMPARADVLIPKEVQYAPEVQDDAGASGCHIVLILVNDQESIDFHYFITRPKQGGQLGVPTVFGFSIDAGQVSYANGAPTGVNRIAVELPTVRSADFDSYGRFVTHAYEGGVAATTTDRAAANAFLKMFIKGKFDIGYSHKRAIGAQTVVERTFRVSTSPPPIVIEKFQSCLEDLLK
ncbi:MAG TPA: hypothetical protein VFB45_02310 [Pseudolabrys sp.]|nr:hypothetical protein [Pseudolabrys sp.]